MLDENLPTFSIKQSSESSLASTIYLSHEGSELSPEYALRRPDPSLPISKNCYGIALYDSYNPDVLYAEVQVQPEWTQPSLSAAEQRAQSQSGIPPPPVPIVPTGFTIQLYNPDQQVSVKQISGSWNSSAYWEFEMPTTTFRQPSASALDRSQNDPTLSDVTPKISFKWKKDGKLSKDLACYLVGRATDNKKNKEPDIPIAMFKSGKNLTIYQPNMHRVEVEDIKGLEEVFILSAVVIKDIFFNPTRDMFNISAPTASGGRRKNSGAAVLPNGKTSLSPPLKSGGTFPPPPAGGRAHSVSNPNPLTQWEIDAETARLKAEVEAEDRARIEIQREEERRTQLLLETEERERVKREAEVAKETERLRRQFGQPKYTAPALPPRNQGGGGPQSAQSSWHQPGPYYNSNNSNNMQPPSQPPRPLSTPGPSSSSSSSGFFSNIFHTSQSQPSGTTPATYHAPPQPQYPPAPTYAGQSSGPYLQAPSSNGPSSSGFFGFGRGGCSSNRLAKKNSVLF